MICLHEDDLNFGKCLEVTPTLQALHMICLTCGMVGTIIEEQSPSEPEHWQAISEAWHEPKDYFNSEYSANKVIKLTEV